MYYGKDFLDENVVKMTLIHLDFKLINLPWPPCGDGTHIEMIIFVSCKVFKSKNVCNSDSQIDRFLIDLNVNEPFLILSERWYLTGDNLKAVWAKLPTLR